MAEKYFNREEAEQLLPMIEENLGAVSVELAPGDLRDIEDAASKIPVQGARLPEETLKWTDR
jgi:hypothetical protein